MEIFAGEHSVPGFGFLRILESFPSAAMGAASFLRTFFLRSPKMFRAAFFGARASATGSSLPMRIAPRAGTGKMRFFRSVRGGIFLRALRMRLLLAGRGFSSIPTAWA